MVRLQETQLILGFPKKVKMEDFFATNGAGIIFLWMM
jgi:hypothetical protein